MEEKLIIGRNLKLLREANGFTQQQVADSLNIQRSAYANYESGERETPINILEKAAELFGCELAILFDEDANAVKDMLVCAFRADDITPDDLREIAAFKNIVLNYLKTQRLLSQ